MKKIVILFIGLLFLSACAKEGSSSIKKRRACLGTIVEITVTDKDKSPRYVKRALAKAFAEIERIEDLLSRFKTKSDISRINADAYIRMTKVSPETISLLEKSIVFSQLSDGAFDITVYPLMELWGLNGKSIQRIPTANQLAEALDKVGYQHIDIIKQEQSVFLGRAAMSLDLGGIAKGYAVDGAIAILKQEGIQNALVNAGGDIFCLGKRSPTENWTVGVQYPRKVNSILTALEIKNRAVATSGDYQKYIEIEGRRYCHIINARSGYPCTEAPSSVTVLAQDCLTADALATAVFVLGPEEGIDLVNQLENTEAIMASVREEKLEVLVSRGLEEILDSIDE